MAHQRPHLDRAHGDIEVGFANVLGHNDGEMETKHAAHLPSPPAWLLRWEANRPVWLMELVAEMVGTFIYVFIGVGATAAFFITTAAKEAGFGSLLTIGFAYGVAIALALIICGPSSGGHLSPGFTISFWLLKGFPLRKVPTFILAQCLGSFLACLSVSYQYKAQLGAVYAALEAGGPATRAAVFSANGSGGVTAVFQTVGIPVSQVFFNEFMASLILTFVVYAVLDHSNPFVSYSGAPWIIGLAYAAIIWAFAVDTVVLNTARALGGMFACATQYGTQCFTVNSGYSAVAVLTNILTAILGGAFYTLIFADSARPIIHVPATVDAPGPNAMSLRAISRDNKFE